MASKLLMNGYPFFMCLMLFGYEANIEPSLEENPKVPSSYFAIQMTAIQRSQIIKAPAITVPPIRSILSACSALFMREKFLCALLILLIMFLLLWCKYKVCGRGSPEG